MDKSEGGIRNAGEGRQEWVRKKKGEGEVRNAGEGRLGDFSF